MNKEQESLFFYTGNDYLIVNNLLLNNKEYLKKIIPIVKNEYTRKLNELETDPSELSNLEPQEKQRIINMYRERAKTPSETAFIERARKDIVNLQKLAKPAEKDYILYRNIKSSHKTDFETKIYSFKGFSSTFEHPTNEIYAYGDKNNYIQMQIFVPKGTKIIKLADSPECENEKGEIILLPFVAEIESRETSADEKCDFVVHLTVKENLKIAHPQQELEKH